MHRRLLSMEMLEGRRLLVSSGVPPSPEALPQNFANPEDTNNDGFVSPGDALSVINALNNGPGSGSPAAFSTDVDGDGIVSPRDALLVINRLNSGSDTSSVPPQKRAIGLRKALDAGFVPPKMSLSEAREMLETLESGGHYEAGERYRNGQMLNLHRQPQDLTGADAGAESEDTSAEQTDGGTSENLDPVTFLPQSVAENDPFALFESPDETLTDPLHDATLWHAFLAPDPCGSEVDDRFSIEFAERLAERLASTDTREQVVQTITDALHSGDKTAEDILVEIAELRATLGDAHSQVAQVFANADVEGIIDQVSVDLGTLAEAVLSFDHSDSADHETIFAEFLSREYLDSMGEILP